jgi:hypothetical protein
MQKDHGKSIRRATVDDMRQSEPSLNVMLNERLWPMMKNSVVCRERVASV